MMKYYLEIRLMDEIEIGLGFLWQKLYQKLHLSLVELADEAGKVPVGVSFPEYQRGSFPLGDRLRLFAEEESTLKTLRLEDRLADMAEYLTISEIREVPKDHGYAAFSRKQIKNNPLRLARRYAKRHDISLEEALKRYENFDMRTSKLPYFNFRSSSTGQRMMVFVQKSSAEEAREGSFNTFGLSAQATVPDF
jgi:CRISPR-associated endonuclease Csy4